ncbi:MAG: hypothetical protein C0605_07860 [Hyphomicrobiales bacterium]|nr:MAG: hypothetical protein C0605_07860 [Hyphomicrobiales bacterium]
MTETLESGKTAEIIARLAAAKQPILIDITDSDGEQRQILASPDGLAKFKIDSVKKLLAEYLETPEHRTGIAVMLDIPSLIAHANRFKNSNSALFATHGESMTLTAKLDYHDACNTEDKNGKLQPATNPLPRFCRHSTKYRFPFSPEWNAWMAADGNTMNQVQFAEFLEDRIMDVMAPPEWLTENTNGITDSDKQLAEMVSRTGGRPCGHQRLMELSRGLKVHDNQTVTDKFNTSTGETSIQFESTHKDTDGKPIKVPNLFLIAIPVFKDGPLYRIAVRLRYRLGGGKIQWTLMLHRPDIFRDHAFREACEEARDKTGLPLFYGTPEE